MKIIISTFLLLVSVTTHAQVSYLSSNYAAIADSYLVSASSSGLGGFSFSTTGAGYAWNYSTLPVSNQYNVVFFNPVSGGYRAEWCIDNGYVLTCNANFNALTNLATQSDDSFSLGPVSVSNIVNQYRKSVSALEYTMVGYTIDLGSAPIPYPVQYTKPDSIYRFPLVYGNSDSSHSLYSINLTGIGVPYTEYAGGYRRNYVDGWGSLITPYGTFPSVLKVKTIIVSSDTITTDTLTIHTQDTTVEYKWFDTTYGIPILEADGNIVGGEEVITGVTYIDSPRCLTPSALFIQSPLIAYFDSSTASCIITFNNVSNNYDSSYWRFGDGNSSSANSPTDTFHCPGTYYATLVVYNHCSSGAVLADTITLPVDIHDTTFFASSTISPGGSTTFCTGGSVLLTGIAVAGYSYQWLKDGVTITGAVTNAYTATTSGAYNMVITNSTGCTDTSNSINVIEYSYPSAAITPPGPVSFCSGDSLVLSATPGAGYTYKWYRGAIPILGATGVTYTVNNAGSYLVVISNGGCKDTSATTIVSVNPLPTATITPLGSTTFCMYDSVVLLANTGAGLHYEWYAGGIATSDTFFSFAAHSSGIYSVVITDGNGCSNTSAGVTVSVEPLPAATIMPAGMVGVCSGDSTLLSAFAATGYTYQWYDGTATISGATGAAYYATGAGYFSVVVTNSSGCKDTSAADTAIVHVPPVAGITYSGDTVLCTGDSLVLTALSGTGISYQWFRNGVSVSGATESSYTADTAGLYTVVETNLYGCYATSAAQVLTMFSGPLLSFATPVYFCRNGSVLLSVTATGDTAGITYEWTIDSIVIFGATNSTWLTNVSANYACEITLPGTCYSYNAAITVGVYPVVIPVVTISGSTLSTGTYYNNYQWYSGDTAVVGDTTYSITAFTSGNYWVIVTDSNGCQDTSGVYTATGLGITNAPNAKISIYPNPVTDMIFINAAGTLDAIVTNMVGETLLDVKNTRSIDVSQLASGLYIIRLYDAAGVDMGVWKVLKL